MPVEADEQILHEFSAWNGLPRSRGAVRVLGLLIANYDDVCCIAVSTASQKKGRGGACSIRGQVADQRAASTQEAMFLLQPRRSDSTRR